MTPKTIPCVECNEPFEPADNHTIVCPMCDEALNRDYEKDRAEDDRGDYR